MSHTYINIEDTIFKVTGYVNDYRIFVFSR
jgi:hypothetical protein